jgi:hypothetical protein
MTRRSLGASARRWFAAALCSVASVALAPAASPAVTTSPAAAPSRATAPVVTVSRTAPGQTGYVHYFIITGPDGEPETQVGFELPGDRIAWSFPEMGVSVSPFVASGQIVANGKPYEIEHLYGLRPFPDEQSMAVLRRELDHRIAWWLDQKTPYCDEEKPSNRLCLSCLGFVLRVLYPGASPAVPAMPADFKTTRKNIYTTEDLLMYLAGVRPDVSRQARLKRISTLKVPDTLREELVRLASEGAADATAAKPETPRPALAKPKATGRSVAQTPRRAVTRHGS